MDLPPYVSQLLLISTKGCKGKIVKGILDHFNMLDKQHTMFDFGIVD